MDYKIEFTDKEITPWAGIRMLKKMLDKMDFDTCLDGLGLPAPGSNRGYSSVQLIKQFMTSVWCGVHHQMKTLRYNVFAIGGYIIKNGSQRILKLSLAMKRREWFTGLWMNTNAIKTPLSFTF